MTGFTLPVFLWEDLEDEFCQHLSLSGESAQIAKEYLLRYRTQNGLSKPEEKKLKELPYGKEVRSLAKLCNLNVSSIVYNVCNQVKKPYALLKQGKLLPPCENLYRDHDCQVNLCKSGYGDHFGDLYKPVTGIHFLSYLALLRYYGFPYDLTAQFEVFKKFFGDIEQSMLIATGRCVRSVMEKYDDDRFSIGVAVGNNEFLLERLHAKMARNVDGMDQRMSFLQHAKALASQIIAKFSETDYRGFISKSTNFDRDFFLNT